MKALDLIELESRDDFVLRWIPSIKNFKLVVCDWQASNEGYAIDFKNHDGDGHVRVVLNRDELLALSVACANAANGRERPSS